VTESGYLSPLTTPFPSVFKGSGLYIWIIPSASDTGQGTRGGYLPSLELAIRSPSLSRIYLERTPVDQRHGWLMLILTLLINQNRKTIRSRAEVVGSRAGQNVEPKECL
jgi:hypothetical protein